MRLQNPTDRSRSQRARDEARPSVTPLVCKPAHISARRRQDLNGRRSQAEGNGAVMNVLSQSRHMWAIIICGLGLHRDGDAMLIWQQYSIQ